MKKTLVTYFSATGVTAKAANELAKAINADTFEIKAKIPYTNADLDWYDKQSRSSVEMNDKTYRPEISEDKIDINKYDVIFVGFPIWWRAAPTVINTFLEKYDFSGKTVVIFATSRGSGFGHILEELGSSLSSSAIIKEGMMMNKEMSESQIRELVAGLNL